jgi:hypothetical protein
MGKCITCGIGFSGTTRQAIEIFKKQYEKQGITRWVYVNNGKVTISRNYIPNNGEYFRIDEWQPK